MKYKIGDVSKFLQISPDLLRYYEKKGVVHPEKGQANDYRYYDTWDMNFLVDCIWYKGFGFGIEQIAQMVTTTSYDELMQIMVSKEDDLRESIRMQSLLLRRAGEYLDEMNAAREQYGKCDLCDSPQIVRYLNRYNFIYDNSADVQQIGQQWLKYMPFSHRCFDIEPEALLSGGDDYAWGFSLGMEYVKEFQVPIQPPVVEIPAQRCVHSVFKSAGKNNFSPRLLQYALDWADQQGLTILGGARGHLLCSVLEDDELTGYFEVWIPVKE